MAEQWPALKIASQDYLPLAGGTISGSLNIRGNLRVGSQDSGDIRSLNWNGAVPADLGSAPDPAATTGFYLDSSAGVIQALGFWGTVQLPPGVVLPYGAAAAPLGYLLCDGTSYATADYPDLFAIIGYTFGGAGASFNVPDMRGRFPLGLAAAGTGSTLGGTGGAIDHTHSVPALSVPSLSVSVTTSGSGSAASNGAHTHTGPSHLHTGPVHDHGAGTYGVDSHTHTFSDTATSGAPSSTTPVAGSGGSAASAGHTHSVSVSGTSGGSTAGVSGSSGSAGGGNTGSSGTGATGSDGAHTHSVSTSGSGSGSTGTGVTGTGTSGTGNPPFLSLSFIVKT